MIPDFVLQGFEAADRVRLGLGTAEIVAEFVLQCFEAADRV